MKAQKEKNVKKQTKTNSKDDKNSVLQKSKKKKLKAQQATEEGEDKNISKKSKDEKPKAEVLIKSLDTSIFQYFKELTNENEQQRMQAAVQLLQQLAKTKDEEKRKKELAYTLKRLIRGCGAATNIARSGFYTGLVALLKSYRAEDLPLSLVFETLDKELHVGSVLTNKEDADAVVGRILTCNAILHSERINLISQEDLTNMTNILLTSTRYKTYHVSLGYSSLAELLEKVDENQFKASVWPSLQSEISKAWSKQNIDTIHCVILAEKKFPKIVNSKFLKAHFGGKELLNEESFEFVYKIFWEHTNIDILAHNALEEFGKYAAKCSKLCEFWENTVDLNLQSTTKLMELVTLKISTDILNNLSEENSSKVLSILSDNFVKMVVEGLKVVKQRKDETIKAFYTEFLEALVKCCSKLKEDAQKAAVIKKMILDSGSFDIEKYTETRIIHQMINFLNEEGIKEIYSIYKEIFLNNYKKPKSSEEGGEESWSQFERLNAGYMLQQLLHHKNIQKSFQWRQKQLKSLLAFGVFHVDANFEVCQKSEMSSFSEKFGDQCKKMFFSSLQSKFIDLHEEQKLLFKLVESCNGFLEKNNYKNFLRLKNFDKTAYEAWGRMYKAVSSHQNGEKKSKKNGALEKKDNLQVVFQILLLNMGLHLFKEPEMAIPSIDDLLKCLERTSKKQKEKKKTSNSSEEEEEPEWIEVVVDLLLHLLSQNSNSLRQIVDGLFTHLCGSLNLNAVHHILSMLDMKDGNNPLTNNNDEEEEEQDEEEEEDDEELEEAENEESEEEDEDEDDDEDEEEDDDDDEEDEDEDEEEVSNADKLRNAISQVLMESGAGANLDDDMESVDLNDISEEEGRKLDEALANAFKALKKPTTNGSSNKKTKVYRVQTTTVMHFRIRVLDLIEIYLQKNPSLMMVTEIMLAVFNMLEFCFTEELKPLHTKVEKVLNKLSQMKANSLEIDLKEENFVDFIRLLVEKKTLAAAYNSTNVLRNKCVIFLINCSSRACKEEKPKDLIKLIEEYVEDFIQHRNPTMNITLLSEIFKLRWAHVWPIAFKLVQTAIKKETRGFRRLQTFELLTLLYHNHGLHLMDAELTSKYLSKIEKPISGFITSLADNNEEGALRQSPKEFQNLLEFLVAVQKAHTSLKTKSALCSSDLCESIQKLRKNIRLENFNIYQHYCSVFKLAVVKNKDLENLQKNGKSSKNPDNEEKLPINGNHLDEETEETEESSAKSSKKRKASGGESAKDLKKQKKQKKLLRLEASSKGLVEGHRFMQTNGSSSMETDGEEEEAEEEDLNALDD